MIVGLGPYAEVMTRSFGLDASQSSGARRRLSCHWQERKHGSFICDLSDGNQGPFNFTSLFVDGRREILARFPDANPDGTANYLEGTRFLPPGVILPDFDDDISSQRLLAIEFDPVTFTQKRWGSPEEAILVLNQGDKDIRIPVHSMDYDHNLIWCIPDVHTNSIDMKLAPRFYVENLYEELTAPREWYLDRGHSYLFYRPTEGTNMQVAQVEVS